MEVNKSENTGYDIGNEMKLDMLVFANYNGLVSFF